MGDLTLAQMQAKVLRVCGNIPTTDPYVVAGDHTGAINEAACDLIEFYPNHFPEHHARTFTQGPTVVGKNQIGLPSYLLVLQAVKCSREVVVVGSDPDAWAAVREYVVSPSDEETIALMDKSTSVADYPTLYARKTTNIVYYPTTRTGKTTYFNFYGITCEQVLSAAGDTFRMSRRFDEPLVLLASAKFSRILGREERAQELETAAHRKMGGTTRIVGLERAQRTVMFTAGGAPR